MTICNTDDTANSRRQAPSVLKAASQKIFGKSFLPKGSKLPIWTENKEVSRLHDVVQCLPRLQDYNARIKHSQFVKLFPGMTIAKFDELKAAHRVDNFELTICTCLWSLRKEVIFLPIFEGTQILVTNVWETKTPVSVECEPRSCRDCWHANNVVTF
jgi:hypothetical protein